MDYGERRNFGTELKREKWESIEEVLLLLLLLLLKGPKITIKIIMKK
jgi:hypothetical protein